MKRLQTDPDHCFKQLQNHSLFYISFALFFAPSSLNVFKQKNGGGGIYLKMDRVAIVPSCLNSKYLRFYTIKSLILFTLLSTVLWTETHVSILHSVTESFIFNRDVFRNTIFPIYHVLVRFSLFLHENPNIRQGGKCQYMVNVKEVLTYLTSRIQYNIHNYNIILSRGPWHYARRHRPEYASD